MTLNANNVLITSTDTSPGFFANLSQERFEKLNLTKKGRANKPYLFLIETKDKLAYFVQIETITPSIHQLLFHEWQFAITFVVKANHNLPFFNITKNHYEGIIWFIS